DHPTGGCSGQVRYVVDLRSSFADGFLFDHRGGTWWRRSTGECWRSSSTQESSEARAITSYRKTMSVGGPDISDGTCACSAMMLMRSLDMKSREASLPTKSSEFSSLIF